MDILIYLLAAGLGIILWIATNEIGEKILDKKTDEVSRIKKTSRVPHSFEDHNTQYRKSNQTTISFWRKDRIDSATEKRLRHSIRTKIKDKSE